MDIEELKALVKQHEKAKATLAKATQAERALRDTIGRIIAPTPREGANTLTDVPGFKKLTLTQPINRTVDPALLDAVRKEIPDEVYASVFRFKPEVVAAQYRAVLAGSDRKLRLVISSVVTEKPGMPQLEIKRG